MSHAAPNPPSQSISRFSITHMDEIETVPCPCGSAKRAFADDPDQTATFHITEIHADSKAHYHKKLTEIYHIIEGDGEMELDGERFPIRPGSTIMIKPFCKHRAIGKLKVIIVPIPAFDPADEWFD